MKHHAIVEETFFKFSGGILPEGSATATCLETGESCWTIETSKVAPELSECHVARSLQYLDDVCGCEHVLP